MAGGWLPISSKPLGFAQNYIQAHAPKNMRAAASEMAEEVVVGAAGRLEEVGQLWQAVEGTLVVYPAGESHDVWSQPVRIGVHGTERVRKYVSKQRRSDPLQFGP